MKRIASIFLVVVLALLLLAGVILLGLQTPAGQELLTNQAGRYLRKKLQTRVDIESIRFHFPEWIRLEGVYIEDTKGDTLLYGRQLYAQLDMWGLVRGKIAIKDVLLEGVRGKVYKAHPDTVFNYQFVINAFSSGEPSDSSSTPLEMRWDQLRLKEVHVSYLDEPSGVDSDIRIPGGTILFSAFNPSYSRYHPTDIRLERPAVSLRLFEGTQQAADTAAPRSEEVPESDTLDLRLGNLSLTGAAVRFRDDVSGMYTGVEIQKAVAVLEKIYLEGRQVEVKDLLIENSATVVSFEKRERKEKPVPGPAPEAEGAGWTVGVGRLQFLDNRFQYDDFNAPALRKGVDFSHLDLREFSTEIADFIFTADSTAGKLVNLAFADKSGFRLDQATTEFAYTSREAFLKNLLVRTPHTTLGDHLSLRYQGVDQLTGDLGKVGVDMVLKNSRVGFQDLLLLAPDLASTPPFDKNPRGFVTGSGTVTGTIGDLQIREAVFTMPEHTRLALSGKIQGLPDAGKMVMALDVQEVTASASDLRAILPANTLPENLTLPDTLTLSGKLEGSLDALEVDALLNTSMGNARLKGNFLHMTDSLKAEYTGQLVFEQFDAGRFLQQSPETLGKVSLEADFSGQGLTLTRMDAKFSGNVADADINGYRYRNLRLTGALQSGVADFNMTANNPDFALTLDGKADLNQEYPAVTLTAQIDTINLKALNFYPDSVGLSGKLGVDLASTDPASPRGRVDAEEIVLSRDGKRIPVGAFHILLSDSAGTKEARLEAPFAHASLSGNFSYADLGAIFQQEINKYFTVSGDSAMAAPAAPYRLDIEADLAHHEALQVFAPALTRMDPVVLKASLSSAQDTTLSVSLTAPAIVYDSTRITGVSFRMTGDGQKAGYEGHVNEVLNGGFRVRNIEVGGDVADNEALLNFVVKDSVGKDRHAFVSRLRKEGENYRLNLQNRLLLDYRPWRTDAEGYVQYGPEGVLVNNFSLRRNRSDEKLIVNSVGDAEGGAPYPNGPIRIVADSVALGPLITLALQDSTLADGRLDGDILIRDYMGEAPAFEGDLRILGMKVMRIALGDFMLKATNRTRGRVEMTASLKGTQNDLTLSGSYLSGADQPLDFDLDLRHLDAKTIEAFSFGELRNAAGHLNGKMSIRGNTSSPELDGALHFNDVAFHVRQLGARYAIENGAINFAKGNLAFNRFTLSDTLQQKLQVDGTVSLTDLPNVSYNLKISTDKFLVMNASRKDNEFVYGKAFAKADIAVRGRGAESVIDGSVKILNGSDVTLILPDDAGAISRGDGIVEFTDSRRITETDTSLAGAQQMGVVVDFASELSLNIETDKDAQFTVVIDELNGDNLKVKGNAQLNTGLAPNGQLYLLGLYELEEGSYELSFEILRKQFDIRKGSQLVWSGDPMKAELDITAVYAVQADPSGFSPTNYRYGKVPFNVLLRISGNLSNPKVEFDLEVSEKADNSIRDKIDKELILKPFQEDPAEMNKQVFALLLMNKFMTETSNVSFGGFSAEAIARQSVSKLLSDQLNTLASDLVKGVQLDFNLNSTTGATGGRTDLNVGLTKGFLNDRVTVSVGRNFELENSSGTAQSSEIFDNIAVNYRITRDGRYLLRAYRKNQFQTVLEGFIVETGVSFIVTLDYDLVKEFFQK